MSIDLTLERIQRLYHLLPPYTRPTIHIAGTNGKGSVCALVASILRAASPPLSVGRFNSPHLVSINDSIIINEEPVSLSVYNSAKDHVLSMATKHDSTVSSFELLTLTALVIFERAQVDFVVLEVGMGGRLDATNVIPDSSVVVSALTSVDLDHQAFLGSTVSAITHEKAAIARKDKPFVLGSQKYSEVESVCRSIVAEKGGELFISGRVEQRHWDESLDGPTPPPFSASAPNPQPPAPQPVSFTISCFQEPVGALLPLHGEHQLDNLALALTIVSLLISHPSCISLGLSARLTPSNVTRGIATTRWRGRLSFHLVEKPKLLVLADGAHNPASAETLAQYVHHLCGLVKQQRTIWITYILALSHSPPKTPIQTLSALLPQPARDAHVKFRVAALRFTSPEGMPWVKSVPPAEIRDAVRSIDSDTEVWVADESDEAALDHALRWAATKESDPHLVVIAGSLYLVADFYRILQLDL
ncbi:folylpolyglutamate synthase [Marasmius tenuissimus]|uniref:Folylpolyglutamate synthase n=1 Tax=Marasmius tenuissimus TaxID=585030 RepID=A0ABR3A7D7_9AGAR